MFDLIKKLMGSAGAVSALMPVVQMLLSKENGGLAGLIQKFEAAGMGDMIKGWVSTGPNPKIEPSQLQQVLGNDMVQAMAAKAGLSPDKLLGPLAGMLPGVIDQLTPDGKDPGHDALEGALGGVLKGLLGGKG